jgi:ABC-2 type transport system permease protein
MPRPLILLGKVLGGSTIATLHGSLVLLLARFADVTLSIPEMLTALGLMFVLSFGLTSFGVILAARVRSFEGFGVFSNTIILPLYFTSSSVFPLDPSLTRTQMVTAYPEWLVFMMQVNPITYAVDSLRGVVIGFNQFPPHYGLMVIFGMAVLFFVIALIDFGRS